MRDAPPPPAAYRLDDQVGYLLRLAAQRHAAIFQARAEHGLTPTQFAALMRLRELGQASQNDLGRRTGLDGATVKGVVGRLTAKGLVLSAPDPADRRRNVLSLTAAGRRLAEEACRFGHEVSAATLAPLSPAERDSFVALLRRMT
ncbi:MAG: MarR family winged helix-turn-helix transcriptional regulator [Rhodobacteraceae bacterium]|nr:MarR family winged helix-turn-helix transcriptional regulator [Paracoccaceae bacterium]